MDITKEAAERLVLRRVVTGGVVVRSYHLAIGPSVLVIRRQLGLQSPYHFGLATDIEGAHRFRSGQVPFRNSQLTFGRATRRRETLTITIFAKQP
ncbi:hypothetical protein LJR034_003076 [Caballeronia sp. LjRoot34]|uniref:hypothetical protein n=1 Tax=Caballeronia sp. LjRoot34 TaxID=3342325 RepID=UPI003ECC9ACA